MIYRKGEEIVSKDCRKTNHLFLRVVRNVTTGHECDSLTFMRINDENYNIDSLEKAETILLLIIGRTGLLK